MIRWKTNALVEPTRAIAYYLRVSIDKNGRFWPKEHPDEQGHQHRQMVTTLLQAQVAATRAAGRLAVGSAPGG